MALDLKQRFKISAGWANNKLVIEKVASRHSGTVLSLSTRAKYRKMFSPNEFAGIIHNYLTQERKKEKPKQRAIRHKKYKTHLLETLSHHRYLKKHALFVCELMNELSKNDAMAQLVADFFAIPDNVKILYAVSQKKEQFPIAKALVNNPQFRPKANDYYGKLLGKLIRAEHQEFITAEHLRDLKNRYSNEFDKTLQRSLDPRRTPLYKKIYQVFLNAKGFRSNKVFLLKEKLKRNPSQVPDIFTNLENCSHDQEVINVLFSLATEQEQAGELDHILTQLKLIGSELSDYFLRANIDTFASMISNSFLSSRINPKELVMQYCTNLALEKLEEGLNNETIFDNVTAEQVIELSLIHQTDPQFSPSVATLKRNVERKSTTLDAIVLAEKTSDEIKESFFANRTTQEKSLWMALEPATRLRILIAKGISRMDAAREDKTIFMLLLTQPQVHGALTEDQILPLLELHYSQITDEDSAVLDKEWIQNLTDLAKLQLMRIAIIAYDKSDITFNTFKWVYQLLRIDPMSFKDEIEIITILFKHRELLKDVLSNKKYEELGKKQDVSFQAEQCPDLNVSQSSSIFSGITSTAYSAVSSLFGSSAPKLTTVEPPKTLSAKKNTDIELFEKMTYLQVINQLIANQYDQDYRAFLSVHIKRVRAALFKKLRENKKETADISRFFAECTLLREWSINEAGPLLSQSQKMQIAVGCGAGLFAQNRDVPQLFISIFQPVAELREQEESFEKEFQSLLRTVLGGEKQYQDFVLSVAFHYKHESNYLANFYGFVNRTDKRYGIFSSLRTNYVTMASYIAENKEMALAIFTEEENEHLLGLMGEELINVHKKFSNDLNECIDKIFEAAEHYPAIYAGIVRVYPAWVLKNKMAFLEVAHKSSVPALRIFKHEKLWRILVATKEDNIAYASKKLDILRSLLDILSKFDKTSQEFQPRLFECMLGILIFLQIKPDDSYELLIQKVTKLHEFREMLSIDDEKKLAGQLYAVNKSVIDYLLKARYEQRVSFLKDEALCAVDPCVLIDMVVSDDDILNDKEVAFRLACTTDPAAALPKYILNRIDFSDEQKAQIIVAHRNTYSFKEGLKDNNIPSIDLLALASKPEIFTILESAYQIKQVIVEMQKAQTIASRIVSVAAQEVIRAAPVPTNIASCEENVTAATTSNKPVPPPPPPPLPPPILSSSVKNKTKKPAEGVNTPKPAVAKTGGFMADILQRRYEIGTRNTEKNPADYEIEKQRIAHLSAEELEKEQACELERAKEKAAQIEMALENHKKNKEKIPTIRTEQSTHSKVMSQITSSQFNLKKVVASSCSSATPQQVDDTENAADRADALRAQKKAALVANPVTTFLSHALAKKFKSIHVVDDNEDEESWDDDDKNLPCPSTHGLGSLNKNS